MGPSAYVGARRALNYRRSALTEVTHPCIKSTSFYQSYHEHCKRSYVNANPPLRLPETAGLALPETYEEAIDLDAKTYTLLKTEEDDSEAEYNEADVDSQFENLDFADYEMRYSFTVGNSAVMVKPNKHTE